MSQSQVSLRTVFTICFGVLLVLTVVTVAIYLVPEVSSPGRSSTIDARWVRVETSRRTRSASSAICSTRAAGSPATTRPAWADGGALSPDLRIRTSLRRVSVAGVDAPRRPSPHR